MFVVIKESTVLSKRDFLGMLGITALSPWAAAQTVPGVSSKEIVLGQSLDLTGPLREMSPDMVSATQVYLDAVNAQGGVHGRRIRMVTMDDGYEPPNTVKNVNRMMEDSGVFALCNLTGTANVAAILPLLTQQDPPLPLIAPFTGADLVRSPAITHVFNIRASYGDEAEKLVQHLTTLGVLRIGVLWVNNGFGKDGLAGVRRSMEKRGYNLHADAPIQADASDVQRAVASLSRSGPDAIIMITAGAPTVAFIKAYRAVNRATRFYTLSVMGTQATVRALGPEGVGVVVTTVVPLPWSQSMPLAREYRTALTQAGFAQNISLIGMEAYLNIKVLVEGLRRAGKDLTRARFMEGLESLRRVDFGGFEVDFGRGVRQGSRFVDLTIIGQGEKFIR
ncbi:MAG: ABC transporter substrate-binding protein [Acidovorax sp.]